MTTITIDNPMKIPALLELEMLIHLRYYYNFLTCQPQYDKRCGDLWNVFDARVEQLIKADAVDEFHEWVIEKYYDAKIALEFAAEHLKEGGE